MHIMYIFGFEKSPVLILGKIVYIDMCLLILLKLIKMKSNTSLEYNLVVELTYRIKNFNFKQIRFLKKVYYFYLHNVHQTNDTNSKWGLPNTVL